MCWDVFQFVFLRNLSLNFSYLCGMFRCNVRGKIHFDILIPFRKELFTRLSVCSTCHLST